MSNSKSKITSPRGVVAGFCAIQEPTWDFNKTKKEYQIKVAFEADEVAGMIARLEKLRDAHFDEVLSENPKLRKVLKKADIGEVEYGDDGEETGRILFRFRQAYEISYMKNGEERSFKKKVGLFDSRGKAITTKLRIGGGSVVKVSFEPHAYMHAKDKEVGIAFNRLGAVQLITYVEYEGGDGVGSAEDNGFGNEDDGEGFDASAYTDPYGGDQGGADDDDDLDDEIPF